MDTKRGVENLCNFLERSNYGVISIHGGKKQIARQEAIKFLNLASAETGIKFLIFHGFINKGRTYVPQFTKLSQAVIALDFFNIINLQLAGLYVMYKHHFLHYRIYMSLFKIFERQSDPVKDYTSYLITLHYSDIQALAIKDFYEKSKFSKKLRHVRWCSDGFEY